MKRIVFNSLVGTLLFASAIGARGQGTVFLNNYDVGHGIFIGSLSSGFFPAPAGTLVQVLGGVNISSLSPIATTSPGNATVFTIQAAEVNALGPGTGSFFDVGYGFVIGVAPGASGAFQVIAWQSGYASYAAAQAAGAWTEVSQIWTQGTGTHPPLPALPTPTVLQVPAFPTPEPSTIALSLLGAAALFLRRRK